MSPVFVLFLVLAYISGSLPWAVWLGRLFFHTDVRSIADGNPGAANAYRLGGWPLGVSVLLLDFSKAFIPVLVARWGMPFPGDQLLWIALMPTVGHAFSIFLRFRGGRALVTLFGVWAGLTLYEAPLVMGAAAIIAVFLLRDDIHRALVIPITLIAYLLLRGQPTWMLLLVVAQLLILLSKIVLSHRLSGARVPANDRPSRLKT